ncbi:hypothetical protein N431DRAFT_435156 [Stipitochalara longipes BDJ]|nr:hypothetical protein N431DRAFT_435156 [Stipitochalara longipes BDJ]
MKYGQAFQEESVPQWAHYNVDYDRLKNLIKVNTTKDQARALAIPGQADTALQRFEDLFFDDLCNEHDRPDLFVKSKVDEINCRLQSSQKKILRLLARGTRDGRTISPKKYAKLDIEIERCGEETRSLQRFTNAQRMAFHKILKKYKKWTGSTSLGERFNEQVLSDPKSFVRRDYQPLLSQYRDLLITLRSTTPHISETTSPSSSRLPSRRPSAQIPNLPPPPPPAYWNEYDDGSEGEEESYTILVNPEDGDGFPGSRTVAYVFSKARLPIEKVKGWFSPGASPEERRPLLPSEGYFNEQQSAADTDIDDDASSSEFPAGYVTHYATFPSIHDQKFSREREQLLYHIMLGCFFASIVLLAIAGTLVATGKKKLRVEVDAAVLVGVLASLFFGTLAIGTMLYRQQQLSWLHRTFVGLTFIAICVLNGILLVVVAGNTGR